MSRGLDIFGGNWEVQRIYHNEGIILGRLGKGNETSKGFTIVRVKLTKSFFLFTPFFIFFFLKNFLS